MASRLCVLLSLLVCCGAAYGVDVPEYFPEIGNDLGAATWAHAVNSRALLNEALNGDVMMLEADVVLGTLTGAARAELVPVMAHPPATSSDLSLQQFLAQLIAATAAGARKGAKLDFKSLSVLDLALAELEQVQQQLTFPMWLNADILGGPVNSTGVPVDPVSFLEQCKARFPASTLSVGWTTRWGFQRPGLNITEGQYSQQQVDEMTQTLVQAGITQPVTFPVRAGITAHSGAAMQRLLAGTRNSTLTLWSSESDYVDVPALRGVLDLVGRHRVYIDVPEDLREALNTAPAVVPSLALLSSLLVHASGH